MKREIAPRRLRMGCGEGLIARMPAPPRDARLLAGQGDDRRVNRTGKGRR
jgi:hypothetical protein